MQTETKNKDEVLTMRGREQISLSCVEDVLRFDEETVVCRTTLGDLVLEGSSLRVTNFSSKDGILTVEGNLSGLFYDDKKKKADKGGRPRQAK